MQYRAPPSPRWETAGAWGLFGMAKTHPEAPCPFTFRNGRSELARSYARSALRR